MLTMPILYPDGSCNNSMDKNNIKNIVVSSKPQPCSFNTRYDDDKSTDLYELRRLIEFIGPSESADILRHLINEYHQYTHYLILTENYEGKCRMVKLSDIIDKIFRFCRVVRGGFLYSWIRYGIQCMILFTNGYWRLFLIADKENDIVMSPPYATSPIIYAMKWDDIYNVYEISINRDLDLSIYDVTIPHISRSSLKTFKDMSYCVNFVNSYADKIKRKKTTYKLSKLVKIRTMLI